jgi:hypothetical protein
MLQFYKTKDIWGLDVSINPIYVAQIESDSVNNEHSYVIMNSGRRYLIGENCITLTNTLEKLANYNGV